jgi:hypothetical protein
MSDKTIPDVVDGRATRDIEAGEVVTVQVRREMLARVGELVGGLVPVTGLSPLTARALDREIDRLSLGAALGVSFGDHER